MTKANRIIKKNDLNIVYSKLFRWSYLVLLVGWLGLVVLAKYYLPNYLPSAISYLPLVFIFPSIFSILKAHFIQGKQLMAIMVFYCLYEPLSNSLLSKIFRHSLDEFLPENIRYILTIDTVLIILISVCLLNLLRKGEAVSLLKSSPVSLCLFYFLLLLGGVISIFNSGFPTISSISTFYIFGLIIIYSGFKIINMRQNPSDLLFLVLGTSSLILFLGTWVYLAPHLPFFPFLAKHFLRIKLATELSIGLGKISLGNSGHLAAFSMLTTILYMTLYQLSREKNIKNYFYLFVGGASLFTNLLVYSRSTLLVVGTIFIILIIYGKLLRGKIPKVTSLLFFALCAIHIGSGVGAYYSSVLNTLRNSPGILTADNSGWIDEMDSMEWNEWEGFDASGSSIDRFVAMSRGIDLIDECGWRGCGRGTYMFIEKVYTSPHSFPILLFVEGGVLSFVAFLFLLFFTLKWFLVVFVIPFFSTREYSKESVACCLSSLALLTLATLAGNKFIMDNILIIGFLGSLFFSFYNFTEELKDENSK